MTRATVPTAVAGAQARDPGRCPSHSTRARQHACNSSRPGRCTGPPRTAGPDGRKTARSSSRGRRDFRARCPPATAWWHSTTPARRHVAVNDRRLAHACRRQLRGRTRSGRCRSGLPAAREDGKHARRHVLSATAVPAPLSTRGGRSRLGATRPRGSDPPYRPARSSQRACRLPLVLAPAAMTGLRTLSPSTRGSPPHGTRPRAGPAAPRVAATPRGGSCPKPSWVTCRTRAAVPA